MFHVLPKVNLGFEISAILLTFMGNKYIHQAF